MRIIRLNRKVAEDLLRARGRRDAAAENIAARIVADVRRRGDAAFCSGRKTLAAAGVAHEGVSITRHELRVARNCVSADFLSAIRHAARNIRRVAEQQLPRPWSLEVEPGVRIRQLVRPLDCIGCYIPGGRFSLVSTLLMTVVPARVAGVPRIIVASPRANAEVLAAADLLGVDCVARIGGAQAIAALAYGTRNIPRGEKIFGPWNCFVTAAKWLVSADCAIDFPPGPTEAIVLAASGNPRWIAADLLAQAEHAPDAGSFLVTTSRKLAQSVQNKIETQLRRLPRSNPAHLSMARVGAILVASSLDAAVDFVNRFAPEHLSVVGSETRLIKRIGAAGTVFLGPWAAQPLGDYATGSNHVLPTGGWGRRRGGARAGGFVELMGGEEDWKGRV